MPLLSLQLLFASFSTLRLKRSLANLCVYSVDIEFARAILPLQMWYQFFFQHWRRFRCNYWKLNRLIWISSIAMDSWKAFSFYEDISTKINHDMGRFDCYIPKIKIDKRYSTTINYLIVKCNMANCDGMTRLRRRITTY